MTDGLLMLRRFVPDPPLLLRRFGPDANLAPLAGRVPLPAVPVAIAPEPDVTDLLSAYILAKT